MKEDVSIQSFDLPFDSLFNFRPRNTRIERKQIKALLTYPARSFEQSGNRQVRNTIRREAEHIPHRLAVVTDNQETPKEVLTIVPRPDFDFPVWDPLRGDPRVEKIVASLVPKDN